MKNKAFWRWSIASLVLVHGLLIGTGLWWVNSESVTGTQPAGPAAWTTMTLGDGGRKAGNFWTDVDLDVDERDPANPNDDNIYIAATRWEGDNFILFLYVSKDSGQTWTRYKIKTCEGMECFQARVAVDSFREVDIVAVGWQDLTPGNHDIFVQTFCVPKPAFPGLPEGPACAGTSLPPESPPWPPPSPPPPPPPLLPSADPAPLQVIPLTPEMVNISNSGTTSGNHDYDGREWTGSWDLAINSHASCLTNNFPLVWAVWAEDINMNVVYGLSKDGLAWDAPAPLPFAEGLTRFPSAQNDFNGVMYAGTTGTVGNPDVFLVASTDCGTSWGASVNLSGNPGFSDAPHAAVTTDGKIHTVYDDTTTAATGSADNAYTQCTRDGNALTCAPSMKAVSDGAFPHIVTDGTNLFMPYRALPGGKGRGLGFSCSADGGVTWAPAYELTDPAGAILSAASPTFVLPWGVHFFFIKGGVTSSFAYAAWIQAGPNFVRVQFSKGVRPGVGC